MLRQEDLIFIHHIVQSLDMGSPWRGNTTLSKAAPFRWRPCLERNKVKCHQQQHLWQPEKWKPLWQFTVTFHHTPKFAKLRTFMKPSAKASGLHSQATCLTLQQEMSVHRLSWLILTTYGYDSHRRTGESWEREGHKGVCFSFSFLGQAHCP